MMKVIVFLEGHLRLPALYQCWLNDIQHICLNNQAWTEPYVPSQWEMALQCNAIFVEANMFDVSGLG